jgi:Zn finger protein HypA/HybF involved in hydrogenase expression
MHEHSLADAIVEKVEALRRERGASRVTRVVIRVSELASLSEQSLQLMLDHAAEEAGGSSFTVELVVDGLLGHCPSCGIVPISEDLDCCQCGAENCRPAMDEGMLLVSCEFE